MQCMLTDPILEQSHCYQCVFHTLMLFHDATARGLAFHICPESNLVNFEIPKFPITVLGSIYPPYSKTSLGLDLAKNAPFQKFQ